MAKRRGRPRTTDKPTQTNHFISGSIAEVMQQLQQLMPDRVKAPALATTPAAAPAPGIPKHELKMLREYREAFSESNVHSRGRKIYKNGRVMLVEFDLAKRMAKLKVQSDSGKQNYTVKVNSIGLNSLSSECTCPFDWGGICKHEVAALLFLEEYLDQNAAEPAVPTEYDQRQTEFPVADYMREDVRYLGDPGYNFTTAQRLAKEGKAQITHALDGRVEGVVQFKKEEHTVTLQRQPDNRLLTGCTCTYPNRPLCVHKQAILLALLDKYGKKPFESLRDWSQEKRQMLEAFGFALEDDLSGKFDFKVKDGKLQLHVLDPSLHPRQSAEGWQQLTRKLTGSASPDAGQALPTAFALPEAAIKRKGRAPRPTRLEMVYLLRLQANAVALPDFALVPLTGHFNAETGELLKAQEFAKTTAAMPPVDERDAELLSVIAGNYGFDKLIKEERAGFYYYNTPITVYKHQVSEEQFTRYKRFLGDALAGILPLLSGKKVYEPTELLKTKVAEINLSTEPVQPYFVVKEENGFTVVEPFVRIQAKPVPLSQFRHPHFWFLRQQSTLYKIASYEDAALLAYFGEHSGMKVRKDNFSDFFNGFIAPLAQAFEVELKLPENKLETLRLQPEPRVYLKEQDEHLVLLPAFEYDIMGDKREFPADEGSSMFVEQDGKILALQRDKEQERELVELLRALHPDFETQQGGFFYLSFADALKEGWFVQAFARIKEHQIELLGQKDLQGFKYNANRPTVQMRSSSGIDWFDMQMQVSFGEQTVSLKEIRKALVNRQQFVKLGDGTLGMLPEDWLQKYEKLFKHGQIKGDSLQVSKLHFSVIDELSADIDNLQLLAELHEKKQKLLHFREIKAAPLPQTLTATLRDYQTEGYKWLHFLDEFGWGGCLADDMGLGKTLQAIAFLTRQKELHPGAVSLVVVPTSLLFNWVAEAEKFSPHLRLHIYRGVGRDKNTGSFHDYDIILTTYGTLRSDIEVFSKFEFHYAVLDESQAIKNPGSLISKAVRLLKAKNRIAMTGTPIENNTFDLYSQMDFLNPGLLGSQEFFRTEFATPIDKHRSEEKAQELRRLIYPFMLRRTKDEVARELPAKTETVLYCEMGKAQRKVYETFRKKYQQKILNQIETEGLQNSGFLILEGLLKLRQICDSPALLNEEGGSYGHASAKLEELVREIEENSGHHKMLVFSQFIGMLSLVREELEKLGIQYAYLDGQTTDRATQVSRFQLDKDCRVFLISLKAGGTGLNLTEADYVYLVDPWWNPAVEAQAIDRTHRIGQTRTVFAYKMICKDSIEEKILQLQQKKRAIAGDLISTETGLLKKLGKADIEHLFG